MRIHVVKEITLDINATSRVWLRDVGEKAQVVTKTIGDKAIEGGWAKPAPAGMPLYDPLAVDPDQLQAGAQPAADEQPTTASGFEKVPAGKKR